jgi:ParB-like chromosome segregation protein Spo0J
MTKLAIKYKKTADLVPYANNSRLHDETQVAQLVASIQEFGFINPVLLDGANGIIAGHGRVLAAEIIGMDTVPAIELSHLTETQKQAYVIADNKLALNGKWNQEVLTLELQDLQESGFDIDLLGFDPSELKNSDVDYSVLDDPSIDNQIDDMAKGVRKAIQIEFEPEHYEEAQEMVKFWRDKKAYVGMMMMNHLRNEKNKL